MTILLMQEFCTESKVNRECHYDLNSKLAWKATKSEKKKY